MENLPLQNGHNNSSTTHGQRQARALSQPVRIPSMRGGGG
jgi:hypothetical protein